MCRARPPKVQRRVRWWSDENFFERGGRLGCGDDADIRKGCGHRVAEQASSERAKELAPLPTQPPVGKEGMLVPAEHYPYKIRAGYLNSAGEGLIAKPVADLIQAQFAARARRR